MEEIQFLPTDYLVRASLDAEEVSLPHQKFHVRADEVFNNPLAIFFVLDFFVKIKVEVVPFDRLVVVEFISLT